MRAEIVVVSVANEAGNCLLSDGAPGTKAQPLPGFFWCIPPLKLFAGFHLYLISRNSPV